MVKFEESIANTDISKSTAGDNKYIRILNNYSLVSFIARECSTILVIIIAKLISDVIDKDYSANFYLIIHRINKQILVFQ